MIPEDLKKTEESLLRYRDRISNLSKDFEIGLFIYLLGKVKWLILLSFLTLFFGAFIYMRYTPKMYETNTTIQINIKEQPDEFLDIYLNGSACLIHLRCVSHVYECPKK
jgi:uncharacterized protein involved in exopolysaccharide biosynthesis